LRRVTHDGKKLQLPMIASVEHEALGRLHALGREAWPDIALDITTFKKLAARRVGDGPLADVRVGDFYLALACIARLDSALAALDRRYLSGLVTALVRRGYDAAVANDAVQAVRVRFVVGEDGREPRIVEYNGRGSLVTWLRVAAVRTAISACRRHDRERVADDIQIVAAAPSPELDLLGRQLRFEFEAAVRAAFEALSARERNLLRYQMIDVGLDRIAAIYGVHRATSARWVARARKALVAGIRSTMKARLCTDSEELDSILRMVPSTLELSLRCPLTPTPTPR
jgi:RNA polymerase sigma-70 factor (ECF subfamily)